MRFSSRSRHAGQDHGEQLVPERVHAAWLVSTLGGARGQVLVDGVLLLALVSLIVLVVVLAEGRGVTADTSTAIADAFAAAVTTSVGYGGRAVGCARLMPLFALDARLPRSPSRRFTIRRGLLVLVHVPLGGDGTRRLQNTQPLVERGFLFLKGGLPGPERGLPLTQGRFLAVQVARDLLEDPLVVLYSLLVLLHGGLLLGESGPLLRQDRPLSEGLQRALQRALLARQQVQRVRPGGRQGLPDRRQPAPGHPGAQQAFLAGHVLRQTAQHGGQPAAHVGERGLLLLLQASQRAQRVRVKAEGLRLELAVRAPPFVASAVVDEF